MKKSELRKLIKEEFDTVIKETRNYFKPHVSVRNGQILTQDQYTVSYNSLIFKPKSGDKIYFNVSDINFNSGTIIGFGVRDKIGTIYVKLDSSEGEYIEINMNNQEAIERIELIDKGWTLKPGLEG